MKWGVQLVPFNLAQARRITERKSCYDYAYYKNGSPCSNKLVSVEPMIHGSTFVNKCYSSCSTNVEHCVVSC